MILVVQLDAPGEHDNSLNTCTISVADTYSSDGLDGSAEVFERLQL